MNRDTLRELEQKEREMEIAYEVRKENSERLEQIVEDALREIDLLFPSTPVRAAIRKSITVAIGRAWKIGYLSTWKQ